MSAPSQPLPDDPETLKAMLLEARAESERLRQIIRELQRHRFGRRAESWPEDQLLLALEEAEQVEAAGFADEENEPAKQEARRAKRPTNRGALPTHLRKRSLAGALRDKILDLDTVLSRRPVSALCLDLRSRPISS